MTMRATNECVALAKFDMNLFFYRLPRVSHFSLRAKFQQATEAVITCIGIPGLVITPPL